MNLNSGNLTQQQNVDESNEAGKKIISQKIFKFNFQIILGFLIGISISLVAITIFQSYSTLIATLVGGGIGATFIGLKEAIFINDIKPEKSNSNSANQSEENNTDFLSWLYPKEIEPKLRKTYLILISLLLSCFLIALIIHSSNNWLQDFSLDIAAEIIGILLVIFAVDRVIESEREKKDKKKEKVAMLQIKQPILHHFHVLLETFQKVKDEAGNSKIHELADIFERFNTEEASQLSESFKNTDKLLYSIDDIDWLNYLSQECHFTKESLNRTVEKYSLFLQPNLLRSIEEFINSPFIRLIGDYHDKSKLSDDSEQLSQNYEELFEKPEFILLLKQHLIKFFKLIKLFNKNTGEQEKNILLN